MSYPSTQRPTSCSTCSIDCESNRQSLCAQIVTLKDKAHQSFMQVLQIQQLHDEEIQEIHQMYAQKEAEMKEEIERMGITIQELRNNIEQKDEQIRRNGVERKGNSCLLGLDLITDHIDAISLEQADGNILDQSSVLQFQDILALKPTPKLRQNPSVETLKATVNELTIEITHLKSQNNRLKQQFNLIQSNAKSQEINVNSLSKQVKFMTEQIQRLGNDKLRLEKKVNDYERRKATEKSKADSKATTLCSSSQGMAIQPVKRSAKIGIIRRNSSGDGFRNSPSQEEKEVNLLTYGQLAESEEGGLRSQVMPRKSTSSWRGRLGMV